MDEFVQNKLTEWGLDDYIQVFSENKVNKKSLLLLDASMAKELIPEVGRRAIFMNALEELKREQAEEAEEEQVIPSTSSDGKRKLDPRNERSSLESPSKRAFKSRSKSVRVSTMMTVDVKTQMQSVGEKLREKHETDLTKFMSDKIRELETAKREKVGVFGRTGAGKSSLINAIIGEQQLLPTGGIEACTSVMIKIEANPDNKYEATIEFVAKDEWKDEIWSYQQSQKDKKAPKIYDDDDIRKKITAVYGRELNSQDDSLGKGFFKEIPEFLNLETKTISFKAADKLSAELVKYTRSERTGKRQYWPLVKCVTVKVPDNDLLQHVTLVDLPGNGDRNKSRDSLWKKIVVSCSTVWIVADVNRGASDSAAWEILESAIGFMGNGGECQRIHFICSQIDRLKDLKLTEEAKKRVHEEFSQEEQIQGHFKRDSFKVFTVSAEDFVGEKRLKSDCNEMRKLQNFLQDVHDPDLKEKEYVSRAYGILSLIHGASFGAGADQKMEVFRKLVENMGNQLENVSNAITKAYETFQKCLDDGVEKSKSSCERNLESVINSELNGSGFHRTLKSVVEKGGIHKPKDKPLINLNETLSSNLTQSIDEEFRRTFPNERKHGAFNGAIRAFSLDTKNLINNYKDVELQLIFLKTEEDKIKAEWSAIIRDRKKEMYHTLTSKIENCMTPYYKRAATFKGEDTLINMKNTLREGVRLLKDYMFDEAKTMMLTLLQELKEDILKKIRETMTEALDLSLRTDDYDSIPEVSTEFAKVKECFDNLKRTPEADSP